MAEEKEGVKVIDNRGKDNPKNRLSPEEALARVVAAVPQPEPVVPRVELSNESIDALAAKIGEKTDDPMRSLAEAAGTVAAALDEVGELASKLKKSEPVVENERGKEKQVPDTFIGVQNELKKLVLRNPGSDWEERLVDRQGELVTKAGELGVFGGVKERVQKAFEDEDYLRAMEVVQKMVDSDPTHREIDGSREGSEVKKDQHAMIREYCEVAHLVAEYSLKKASGQDDQRLLREINLRGWGTIPFVGQEAQARKYLEKFKTPTPTDAPEGREESGMAQMLEKLMGGIQEGSNKEATPGLLGFLRDMELSEDLDPYNVGLDMKRALNEGKFTREFILAIDAWVGLLRLNKVMEDGGGRYELVEEALRSHNKFNGFVSKPGIARLLRADAGIVNCYMSLLGELGIKEKAVGAYTLDSVFQKSGKDIDAAIQKLISEGKDSTRVKAAYTVLRVLGYYQGVGHAEDFVVKNFIKPRKDGNDSDLDKEDLSIWFEEKKIPLTDYEIDIEAFKTRYRDYVVERKSHGKECKWYAEGKGSLRDILELGDREKFLKALGEDNKRGALFKYWEDNKKRRGVLLAVSGNRNTSSGLSFEDRRKTIISEVTKGDQMDWLFDESPSPNSETVARLCDEGKISKDASTVSQKPSVAATEEAAVKSIISDVTSALKAPGRLFDNSSLGKLKKKLHGKE